MADVVALDAAVDAAEGVAGVLDEVGPDHHQLDAERLRGLHGDLVALFGR